MNVAGAVPKGNATKENIQRMGFEEGQVTFLGQDFVMKLLKLLRSSSNAQNAVASSQREHITVLFVRGKLPS